VGFHAALFFCYFQSGPSAGLECLAGLEQVQQDLVGECIDPAQHFAPGRIDAVQSVAAGTDSPVPEVAMMKPIYMTTAPMNSLI